MASGFSVALSGVVHQAVASTSDVIPVAVSLKSPEGKLEHIWSKCAGSDRAAVSLREQWRQDLKRFHDEAGVERVRFHGIFADELGVYAPSLVAPGKEPNWQNVDRVYDGLIELGVRPFVELSFMPKSLASGKASFGFYGANITPPTSLEEWSAFVAAFIRHLIDRYGFTEVSQWQFEVWNEPNLPFFWSGTQTGYFEFYKATALAVKAVSSKLSVGGPSTSAVQWIPEFLAYCETNNCPVDFVSTHVYAGDKQEKIFGSAGLYSQNDVIPAAMAQVRKQIDGSKFAGAPLWLTEWASDSPAMIAHVIKGCLPYCSGMSHWTFSNVYEELGVAPYILKEGDNGFGMMATGGIPKPQFNTYKLLHRLGETLLKSEGPVLATKRDNGSIAIALWNLAEVSQANGIPGSKRTREVVGTAKTFQVKLAGQARGQARATYVDQIRGAPYPAWRQMGSPQYPTFAQIQAIRKSAELASPEVIKINSAGELSITLPPEGLALIEIG